LRIVRLDLLDLLGTGDVHQIGLDAVHRVLQTKVDKPL
jgi:hypothetical protein